jgi:hypothetical protein
VAVRVRRRSRVKGMLGSICVIIMGRGWIKKGLLAHCTICPEWAGHPPYRHLFNRAAASIISASGPQ